MPVHFEKLALYELAKHLTWKGQPDPQCELFPGGVEVSLPMSVGLELNQVLKIPVRILLRVAEAETKSEEDFKNLLLRANLKKYAPLGSVHVSSRSSFLRFKKSLEQVVYDEVDFKPQKKGADIFIRFFRDSCTVSVNTSGDDLYFRGYDKWVAEAPVRDNIASGLIQLLLKGISPEQTIDLIDPMAGSGTFLLEAFLLNSSLTREFSFNHWSFYKSSVRARSEGLVEREDREPQQPLIHKTPMKAPSPPLGQQAKPEKLTEKSQRESQKNTQQNSKEISRQKQNAKPDIIPPSWRFFASDQLDKNKEIIQHNAETLGMTLFVTIEDLFKAAKRPKSDVPRIVVCNPPYGKRLKTSGAKTYFQDILDRIVYVYSPDRIGMLTPPAWLEHSEYERLHFMDLENSGVETQFSVFYRNDIL